MLKKILIGLIVLSLSLCAEPDWSRSYTEALAQALKEKKLVLVMLSKEGCDACWYMENIVFEDEGVDAVVMKHFVPVYLDVDQDSVPEGFRFIGTPTFYFTDAQGKKISHALNGASNVKDFLHRISVVLEESIKK